MEEIISRKRIIACFGGPSGCGKDEHGDRFADSFRVNSHCNILCYDNGSGLRNIANNIRYTNHMKGILHNSIHVKGETVPGMVTISEIKEFIFKTNTGNESYIFKGPFRTPHEPDLFVEFTDKFLPRIPRYFVRINISDDVVRERLAKREDKDGNKRLDDLNKKTIEERIKQYREKTELIYDKISKSSDFIFFDIDGDRNILDVQEDIRSEIIATESFRTAKNIFNGESPFCPR